MYKFIDIACLWLVWILLNINDMDIRDTIEVELLQNPYIVNQGKSIYQALTYWLECGNTDQYLVNPFNRIQLHQGILLQYNQNRLKIQSQYEYCTYTLDEIQKIEVLDKFIVYQPTRIHTIQLDNCTNWEIMNYQVGQAYLDGTLINENVVKEWFNECAVYSIIEQYRIDYSNIMLFYMCRNYQEYTIYIIRLNSTTQTLIKKVNINQKSAQFIRINFSAHNSDQFIFTINGLAYYYKSNSITQYTIQDGIMVDSHKFTKDGIQIYAMKGTKLYLCRFDNQKLFYKELHEKQHSLENSLILAYELISIDGDNVIQIINQEGYILRLALNMGQIVYKGNYMDVIGICILCLMALSVKIIYF